MGLNPKTRTLTMTVEVAECQSCPMMSQGIVGVRDDYCKLLNRFIWTKEDDEARLFPVYCPLKEK
jgi:hypothetical protein